LELHREYNKELVKRSMVLKIVSAWIVTAPISGGMAALLYFMIRGMFPPLNEEGFGHA